MTNDALRLAQVVQPILVAQGQYAVREISQGRIPNLERWSDAMVEAILPTWAAIYLAGWRDAGHRIVRNRPKARKALGRQTFQVPPQRFTTETQVVRQKSSNDKLKTLISLRDAKLKQVHAILARMEQDRSRLPELADAIGKVLADHTRLSEQVDEEFRIEKSARIIQVTKAEPPRLHAPFFEGVRPHVLDTIRVQVYEFVQATLETSALGVADAIEAFREQLGQGMEQGESVKELNRRVMEIFDDPYRAARIGQTEASRASHAGQLWAAKESGVVAGKRWLASSDACEECKALDGVEKSLDEPFTIRKYGGPYAVVMMPPLHPFCMCAAEELYGESDVDEAELMELLGV